ncbi:MAG TPA: phosphoglycerate mutase family protein [Actinomycetota bacterium]
MSELYLVRHAKAGNRERWSRDDRLRPLSKNGRRQAEALVRVFDGRKVDRILSSPFLRCLQTVATLAADRMLPIEEVDALAEGASLQEVLAVVAEVDGISAVLCSHGDVIPTLVEHLVDEGMRVEGEPDWRKGSTWIIEHEPDGGLRGRSLETPS